MEIKCHELVYNTVIYLYFCFCFHKSIIFLFFTFIPTYQTYPNRDEGEEKWNPGLFSLNQPTIYRKVIIF